MKQEPNEHPVTRLPLSRRSFLLGGSGALGLFALGGPLLSGCGSAASAGANAATVALQAPIVSLDPPLINSIPVAAGVRHMLESFVSLDASGKIVPALAESWEVSADRTTWLLHLRQGVTFHDGSKWTAEVAKMNLDRYLGRPADFPRAQSYGFIDKVTTIDEHTLQVHTASPQAGFLNWTSYFALGFHSGESLEKYKDEVALRGVGTGPFKMVNFVPNERLEMERFDGYWGTKAKLDKLTIRTVPDASSRIAMVETGEAHVAVGVPPAMVPTVQKSKSMALLSTPSVRMVFIGINSQHADLKDVRVRRALNYAVDAAKILETVLHKQGTLARSVVPEMIPGFTAQTPYGYDPQRAAQLLDEAGWTVGAGGVRAKDGRPLKLTIQTTDGYTPGDRSTCEAVQSYLAEAGVQADLSIIDQNGYFAAMQKPASITTTTLNYFAYGSSIVDPGHALGVLEGSWTNINSIYARYRNAEFDAAYKKVVTSVDDQAALAEAAAGAQKVAWDDAPWIFLFSLNSLLANSDTIEGLTDAPHEFYNLTAATIRA
ncbi:glutathione ABC transporter substrate-binding protein [Dactylosporangium fulvum]|uniref:ABC transporter substrate-binding protein n=1 Tax=Dactylosporangium fulvum TaxID=53359 RepID=A0ABY5W9U3_9ACTN|nr:ABC transporter substrate-binding protein [Dactylosporangium fulvum]UWP86793.1 ABC transporter substrate-binding protein [Dactylosporangium fulvum]